MIDLHAAYLICVRRREDLSSVRAGTHAHDNAISGSGEISCPVT
jgi:hypothetical protein